MAKPKKLNYKPKSELKIHPSSSNQQDECKKGIQYPTICLKHLTGNKNYNFEYFTHNVRDKNKAHESFLRWIAKVQDQTWLELTQQNKRTGLETLENHRFSFQGKDIQKYVSPDTKMYVFRFHSEKYRIIGFKDSRCSNTLHIVGFDFDYSAYDHG